MAEEEERKARAKELREKRKRKMKAAKEEESRARLEDPHDDLLVEARDEGQAKLPIRDSDVDSAGASLMPLTD